MKKTIIILIAVIIVLVSIIGIKYSSYIANINKIKMENAEFEKYINQEIYGTDLATVINKSVDQNVKKEIENDEKGFFISNEKDSIHIEIYMQDNETTYKMETIHNAGIEQFVQYYGNIKFKCSKTEYHKKTGKIKYMLFEQIQTG